MKLFNLMNCFKVLTFLKQYYVSDKVALFWRERKNFVVY